MNSSTPETVIEDYRAVLLVPGRDSLPPIVLGGQAVNIWAERYLEAEPALAEYMPFTSKDLDVLGEGADLNSLARRTGFRKVEAQQKVFIPSAGFLEIPRAEGSPVRVEFLKRLYGVTNEEITEAALSVERNGIQLRVVHPITLLRAKAENAVHLPQAKRQDVKHLKMTVLCVRAYLREKIGEVEAEKLSGRDCVNLHEMVLEIASSRTARGAAEKYGIRWRDTMPLEELQASAHTKLRNFTEKRLPRWIETMHEGK